MQPNANLRLTHLTVLSIALVAIYGWGLACLDRELAKAATVVIAAGE